MATYTITSLSWSQVEAFTQCELKWAMQKVFRKAAKPAEALLGGRPFHAALQADGEAHRDARRRLTFVELVDIFRASLSEELAKDDPEELLRPRYEWMIAAGVARLWAYTQELQPHYFPNELEQELVVEETPGLPGVRFTGRFDGRVGDHFVDFKTASKPWPVGAELHKPQAVCYPWLDLFRADGLPRATSTAFHVFPVVKDANGEAKCEPQLHRVVTPTQKSFVWFGGLVASAGRSMQEAVATDTFRASTGPLCGWCGYLEHCDAGRQWLWQKRRASMVPGVPSPTDDEAKAKGWM